MIGILPLRTRSMVRGRCVAIIYGVLVALLLANATVFAAEKPNLYTVVASPISQVLYYSGAIMPIGNQPVISPTEGVVVEKYFDYGMSVDKGDKLLQVRATKLIVKLRDAEAGYLTALTAFNKLKNWNASSTMINAQEGVLKAKRTLMQQEQTYTLNQHLFKLGIIAKDQVTQSKDSAEDAKAAYAQAERALQEAKDKGKGDDYTIAKLKLATATESYSSLKKQLANNTVAAPTTGIILQPKDDNGAGNGSAAGSDKGSGSGPINVGTMVSFQQVLMIVGNLTGVRIKFMVPEININQIHAGQKATITGAGFKGVVLHGEVSAVSAQASSASGGSVATFPASVSVDKVDKAAAKLIRSGMNAQVAITVYDNPSALSVPVSSVFDKNGNAYVKRYNPQQSTSTDVPVKTGVINVKNIEILSGLRVGDKIMVSPHE